MFIQAFARCSIFMAGNREFPLGFSGVGISEKKRGNIRDLRRHLAVLRFEPNRTEIRGGRYPASS